MNKLGKKRFWRWSLVGIWVGTIYSTLYIVRPICEFLRTRIPLNLMMNLGISMLLIGILVFSVKFIHIRKKSTFVLLGIIVLIYISGFFVLSIPEERLHLVEYGILGFLIFWALRLDFKEYPSYIISFVLTALFGWGDEGIQHLLPNRYYQLKDVLLNAASGFLGLVLTFVIRRERFN